MKRILTIALMFLCLFVGAAHAEELPFDYKLTVTPNSWPEKGDRVSFKIEVKNTSESDVTFSILSAVVTNDSLASAKVGSGKKTTKSFPYTISEDEASSGTVDLVISYASGSEKGEANVAYSWPVPVTPKPTIVPKATASPKNAPVTNNVVAGAEDIAFEYLTKFCSNYNILAYESGLSEYNPFRYVDAFDFNWDNERCSYSYLSVLDDIGLNIGFDSNYCAKSYNQFVTSGNMERLRVSAILLFKAANWSLNTPEEVVANLLKAEHLSDLLYSVEVDGWSYSISQLGSTYMISAHKDDVPSYLIQFDKDSFLSTSRNTPKPTVKSTPTPAPTSEWPSLKASSVKYNYANSVGKDFYLSGYGELTNYFNYAYDDYEEDYFCMRVTADDGSYDSWYIYFHRESFEELYQDALRLGEVRLEMKCNITQYQKGQDDMAVAKRVHWWK